MLLGDFNMTLSNKHRSTGSKGFCESQEELMSVITNFDLEDYWKCQNPNSRLYTRFHFNTYSRIDRGYRKTILRMGKLENPAKRF